MKMLRMKSMREKDRQREQGRIQDFVKGGGGRESPNSDVPEDALNFRSEAEKLAWGGKGLGPLDPLNKALREGET